MSLREALPRTASVFFFFRELIRNYSVSLLEELPRMLDERRKASGKQLQHNGFSVLGMGASVQDLSQENFEYISGGTSIGLGRRNDESLGDAEVQQGFYQADF
jgi:hypothetical protein